MQGLEAKLSRHMADSELAALNADGFLDHRGADLLQVLDLSMELSRKTAGAFDHHAAASAAARGGPRQQRPTRWRSASDPRDQRLIRRSSPSLSATGRWRTQDLKHHHIIDPRQGFSPPELASSTVTAPTVALADGLATALMVMGVKDTLDLIKSLDGCEASTYHSTGFFA